MPKKNERRPIKGFPNYEVDNMGNVYSLDHEVVARFRDGRTHIKRYQGRQLRPGINAHGYAIVVIKDEGGKWHTRQIHRLVAEAFIPNPMNYAVVNHKDEVRTNNHVDNLEWCTNEYNLMYGTAEQRRRAHLKGREVWNSRAILGKKIDDDEWVEYPSQSCASRVLNIPIDGISYVCRGMRDSTCGYVFKHAEVSNG